MGQVANAANRTRRLWNMLLASVQIIIQGASPSFGHQRWMLILLSSSVVWLFQEAVLVFMISWWLHSRSFLDA